MSIVNIYQRDGILYVVPTNGLIDLPPVSVVSVAHLDLAKALETAFNNAVEVPPAHPDLRSYQSPVLTASKLRNWRQFERGMKMIAVSRSEDTYVATRYVPDVRMKKGFVPEDVILQMPVTTSLSDIAVRLLNALAE
jgi:hypothetical protein